MSPFSFLQETGEVSRRIINHVEKRDRDSQEESSTELINSYNTVLWVFGAILAVLFFGLVYVLATRDRPAKYCEGGRLVPPHEHSEGRSTNGGHDTGVHRRKDCLGRTVLDSKPLAKLRDPKTRTSPRVPPPKTTKPMQNYRFETPSRVSCNPSTAIPSSPRTSTATNCGCRTISVPFFLDPRPVVENYHTLTYPESPQRAYIHDRQRASYIPLPSGSYDSIEIKPLIAHVSGEQAEQPTRGHLQSRWSIDSSHSGYPSSRIWSSVPFSYTLDPSGLIKQLSFHGRWLPAFQTPYYSFNPLLIFWSTHYYYSTIKSTSCPLH